MRIVKVLGLDWGHVWVKPVGDTKLSPNWGTCSECDRNSDYVARYPNGTATEYCLLHLWIDAGIYLWDMTGEKLFWESAHYVTKNFTYVERLEYVGGE